ncbi:hypothetical protein VOLCADRAFT_104664 [Volvox carteri f. nagariensis]|uniref:DUF1754-domain-containing protein n=1 Tax=Volvox carteri f. nagariensis TaxID=3068 RepID=D8TVM7_VOLCA|nr:uncharacterized protein VOLCADRAFT_104664 [Volvox carteri f. nagariensis]EFJ48610.1 hypothetical protein VOLCADRAFT_104664 [Volvox carteri f. nagariensis]|eukprot:XP_002950409.1 hypothetical protein VOLCADRAFT_104664 [Volvox carteri f. nagariensis]
MSFVGGKLKLKGGESLRAAGGVKKKKRSEDKALTAAGAPEQDPGQGAKEENDSQKTLKAIRGYELDPNTVEDRRTEAEKRYEARFRKVEEQMCKKAAAKSHRERVKEFNEYLAQLSEHHDIPKVGPG